MSEHICEYKGCKAKQEVLWLSNKIKEGELKPDPRWLCDKHYEEVHGEPIPQLELMTED